MPRGGLTKGGKGAAGQALGLTLEGVAEVLAATARLTSQNREFAKAVKGVSVAAAELVAREARDLAPVRTGRLRSAIFSAGGDPKKPDALAGVSYRKAPHAHLVEYGSSRSAAHPYMRPAINYTRGAVAVTVIDGFRKLLDRFSR